MRVSFHPPATQKQVEVVPCAKNYTPEGEVDAVDTDFKVIQEDMSIYETSDPAVRVRVRTIVTRILVARNADGTVKTNQNKEPLVMVYSQNVVTAEITD